MGWRDRLGVGERRWKKAPDEEVQPAKTLWDWLQLLIVPAILIAGTFVWSAMQTKSDNRREDIRIKADQDAAEEARQDATLQTYLDQMSDLMLNKKLGTAELGSAVRAVARTVTLATLRRLDGERKAQVVIFLWEAGLLEVEDKNPQVRLAGADLAEVKLDAAELFETYLAGVNLRGANLANADLNGTDLAVADLRGANLADTSFWDASLDGADLRGADLRGAHLGGADLSNADLRGADLAGAHVGTDESVEGADLWGAHLAGAKNLNLERFITDLAPKDRKPFLDSQKAFLDSLSPEELAKFNLTPEKLATLRRGASGR